ncbi:uncharacterized protein LOC130267201 isoform X1 [Hyla sarda]|uniref:uncharacterized protein LOC130267201 isoform X1 n=1 Tax=Hyla sarda TaxID=327740 RepID=UPI0024C33127|nr:uncharacterized protein LOC130267201 isoform X1 [Hyla sarda]
MPPLGTATTPDPGGSRIIAAGGRKKKRNSVQEGNMATPEDFKKDQSNMKRCDRIGSGQGQKLGKACRHNAERSDRRESGKSEGGMDNIIFIEDETPESYITKEMPQNQDKTLKSIPHSGEKKCSKRKSNDQSMSGEADSEDSNEEKLTLGPTRRRKRAKPFRPEELEEIVKFVDNNDYYEAPKGQIKSHKSSVMHQLSVHLYNKFGTCHTLRQCQKRLSDLRNRQKKKPWCDS